MTGPDVTTQALRSAVSDQGPALLSDPQRLRAVLADLLGSDAEAHRHEIDALSAAAGAGAGRAIAAGGSPDDPQLLGLLTGQGYPPEAARWATWAIAAALAGPTSPVGGSGATTTNLIAADIANRTRMGTVGPATPGPSGSGSGGAGAGVVHGPTPRRRWAVIGAVAAVVVAAAAGVGGTLWATRGQPDSSSQPAQVPVVTSVVTAPAGTRTATPAAVTTDLVTTVVVTESSTSVRTVAGKTEVSVVAGYDGAAYDSLCTPLYDVADDINNSISAWVDSEDSAAVAKTQTAAMGKSLDQLKVLLSRADATGSEVPVVVGIWRDSVQSLRTVMARGGTDGYSSDAWNAAMIVQSQARAGFYDACTTAAGGQPPFTMNKTAADAACRSVRTPLAGAVLAVRRWANGTTPAIAADAKVKLDRLSDATDAVREDYRISTAHPVRRTAETAEFWAFNLGNRAAAKTDPPATWVANLESANTALNSLC